MACRFEGKFVVSSLRKAMTEAAIVIEGQKARTVSLGHHHHDSSPFADFFPRITGKENLIGIAWVRCPHSCLPRSLAKAK